MRAATITVTVLLSALIGSTPVSSLSTLRVAKPKRACSWEPGGAISLVGSQGAFGIVALPSNACNP